MELLNTLSYFNQLVGEKGKDGRWWIAAPVIFCIEKFSTFMWLLLYILFL
jgi:hypothetical protein